MSTRPGSWDGEERRTTNRDRRESNITLNDDQIDALSKRITDYMKSEYTVASDIHKRHHDLIQNELQEIIIYVKLMQAKEKRKQEFNGKLIESLSTGISLTILLSILSFLGLAVWHYIKTDISSK